MALVPKIDPNKIFASNAPTQDKPAAFDNYEKGMDETRKNLGRPTIKQLNYLHQTADQKILWIHQNGGGLPYDPSIEYAEKSVTLKDGELKQLVDGAWVETKTKSLPATAITTSSGQNQQQINDFGGAKWYAKVGGYELGATVKLDNGDIVKSTIPNNINDPNVNMTGWVKTNDAGQLEYSDLADYLDGTVGGALNNLGDTLNNVSGKTVRLIDYIPKSQHAAIYAGTSVYDAAAPLANAIADAITSKAELSLPSGQVNYSSIPNIKNQGFRLVGQGSTKTKLNYTGSGIALNFDAFIDNQPTDPFVHGLFISGFHIVGGSFITGFNSQGVARSFFSDIMVNGSTGVDGTVAFKFSGTMLSVFNNLKTSYIYGDLPYRGFFLQAGTRAAINVGGCSNNVWISTYAEGNSIGIQLASNGGDQNTFIGGSPEACQTYGLLVGQNCRYNTFIGVGAENSKASVTADISDAGIYNEYKNCYSSKKVLIGGTARGVKIEGGFFERIEIQPNASSVKVDDVTVNQWDTGVGGFVDAGFDTSATRIYDADLQAFIYPRKPRFALTVGASPFLYENTHQIPVKVRIIGGTVTQVLFRRGGDTWIEANPTASGGGTGTIGTYLLASGDKIELSYSTSPTVNVITMPM